MPRVRPGDPIPRRYVKRMRYARRKVRNSAISSKRIPLNRAVMFFIRWAPDSPKQVGIGVTANYVAGDPRTRYVVTPTGTTAANFSQSFTLDSVTNANEFKALYDFYKITKVCMFVEYVGTTAQPDAVGYVAMPSFTYTPDYDNNSVLPSVNIMEYGRCKTFRFTADKRVCRIFIKPKANLVANDGTSGNTAAQFSGKAPWLDCNNGDLEHNGIKGSFNTETIGTSANTCIFYVYFQYWLAFKNER